ncbi:hypothetical protein [Dyadobacter sp. Leaf189]|nr:hypothetical protein [Dyadobacter sp. Leaf189]
MRDKKNEVEVTRLSAATLIKHELQIVNAMLKKVDLSKIKTLAKEECAR